MASKPKQKATKFYTVPEQPPMFFMNAWGMELKGSDITIKCGVIFDQTDNEQVVQHLCSLALSHDGFIKFVDSCAEVSDRLKAAYGNRLPALDSLPPESLKGLLELKLKVEQNVE
jgi:hypothetical protein